MKCLIPFPLAALLAALLATLPSSHARSQDQELITGHPVPDAFPIVSRAWGAAAIYVDSTDHWLVQKAATLLQDDIQQVTGLRPALIHQLSFPRPIHNLIIIGSLDQSALMQRLAKQHMIPAEKLEGKWESYLYRPINNPLMGAEHTLIIAGSDRRGTAFGVLQLSKAIGVSPWHWWADVPVPHKTELFYRNKTVYTAPPAVKYRGIFINDEAPALSGWAKATFGGLNHVFYEKVFELLLRLKANYLWPAMWGNAFNDDDTLNPVLAAKYGIVMGTSHHEPMLRAQQEWKRYGTGPWNYQTNAPVLDSFWRKGIQHMDHHESIVTIGMRGDGDMPMEESSNIALLEKIVHDQREIIRDVTGKDPSATPQSWALYKEVQDYYDKGMRVPDDVTLLLCDDNWGNVRKLPSPTDKPRGGGYGLYYHFDYVGDPRNYKWLNTNPIPRVWEQLHLTKEFGDDRLWIVNVGDIKPMEFPIEFFLDYAWDPAQWPADRLPAYTRAWASRQFGPQYAPLIAHLLTQYTRYNSRRKPELLSPDTYSLTNYQEADRVVADYNALAREAQTLYDHLPTACRDAYYQLVLYPILACANLNELYVTAAKNRLYAAQGRSATDSLARRVKTLFDKDSTLSLYYNTEMSAGKWTHMMDQTHIGYTYWQQPPVNKIPDTDTLDLSAATGPTWGLAVEGSDSCGPGSTNSTLPVFHPYETTDHFIELFNRRTTPFDYTITATAPWIHLSQRKGTIDRQQQIRIHIDWASVPSGIRETTLKISSTAGGEKSVKIITDHSILPRPAREQAFLETNGYVSIEAAHYTRAVETREIKWQLIPDLGRTLSGLEATPVTAAPQTPGGNSPHLEYDCYLSDTGAVKIEAYFSPLLEYNGRPLHYAVSIDGETPQIINLTANANQPGAWGKMVADNIIISTSLHTIRQTGYHVLKFWMVDPAVVLQKIVLDAGGVKPSYLGPPESYRLTSTPSSPSKGLKDYYHDYFPIGVAVSPRSLSGPDSTLILQQFNSLTPENAMKMGPIHPEENRYNWKDADAIVGFAQAHGLRVRGHNLCWHEQTPPWLFKDPKDPAGLTEVSKEVLLQRLKDHITTVVERYKGKIYAWDVVNEAIDDDSTKFLRSSPWYRICGEEFIAKAFEYAHAADPSAQLFYNDYNTERPEKRERVYRLLKKLVDAGVPITGIGLQAHWSIYEPAQKDLQDAITRFASLGLKVQITELDISIYPWEKNKRALSPNESDAFTPDLEARQMEQYKKIFSIFRQYRSVITGVTFWNVTDRHTWLDEYPVPGRKNYPLLFDTLGRPKKAWQAVVDF